MAVRTNLIIAGLIHVRQLRKEKVKRFLRSIHVDERKKEKH